MYEGELALGSKAFYVSRLTWVVHEVELLEQKDGSWYIKGPIGWRWVESRDLFPTREWAILAAVEGCRTRRDRLLRDLEELTAHEAALVEDCVREAKESARD